MNFKPMLSGDVSDLPLENLRFPLLLSPKLDGVRCIMWNGVAYSRNAKPIRNKFVQAWAKEHLLHGLDGELIVGSPTEGNVLNRTQSGVMSYEGEPDFTYHIFDHIGPNPFSERLNSAFFASRFLPRAEVVPHRHAPDLENLLSWEQDWLAEGYEGVMLRDPEGPYKHGRSTVREGWLLKLKRFMDGEAVVTGLEEGHVNTNELTRDELGRAKRTRHAENLVPSGMVGTIIAHDPKWGELRISPGTMTHEIRRKLWESHERFIGKTIHWRSFGYGVKDKPRFPRYYGIREDV